MQKIMGSSIVPTIMVGVGGTGLDVVSQVRRLVEESYGSLDEFPIVSFLHIDTDKGGQVSNPDLAGSPLKKREKCHAELNLVEAKKILEEIDRYPWIKKWFPEEEIDFICSRLGKHRLFSYSRAFNRLAFFSNYSKILTFFIRLSTESKAEKDVC